MKSIFDPEDRAIVQELLSSGFTPADIADNWDCNTCTVYKQLAKWQIERTDLRKFNKRPIGRRVEPSKALKILEVAERTLWSVERIALHCGTSYSYTRQVLTRGLSKHYKSSAINLKDASAKLQIVKRMMKEGAGREKAARAVGWSMYKYKYWLAKVKESA